VQRVRDHLPSPAMIVALIALVVALTGTAYAVSRLDGRLIAKRSIPGNRLAAHTIGAGEINKKSLGKVLSAASADNASKLGGIGRGGFLAATGTASNSSKLGGIGPSGFLAATGTASDSSKLGGIASSGFLQGRGHSYYGVADAPVSESATDCGLSVATTRVLEVPGYGYLDGRCDNYNGGVPICKFTFHNTSGSTMTGARESVIGGEKIPTSTFLENLNVASGAAFEGGSNANIVLDGWQVSVGSPPRQLDARVSMSHAQSAVTACHLMAQIVVLGE